MPRRKDRIPVVFDTNVILGFYLSSRPSSVNSKVYRLWRDHRRLQLLVSAEIVTEYLEVLERVGISVQRIKRLAEALAKYQTVTRVTLGARPAASRDADDDLFLATALAGKAKFLITRDYDLLDLPNIAKKKFKFKIISPAEFLAQWETKQDSPSVRK